MHAVACALAGDIPIESEPDHIQDQRDAYIQAMLAEHPLSFVGHNDVVVWTWPHPSLLLPNDAHYQLRFCADHSVNLCSRTILTGFNRTYFLISDLLNNGGIPLDCCLCPYPYLQLNPNTNSAEFILPPINWDSSGDIDPVPMPPITGLRTSLNIMSHFLHEVKAGDSSPSIPSYQPKD